jgi:hypothetical protein
LRRVTSRRAVRAAARASPKPRAARSPRGPKIFLPQSIGDGPRRSRSRPHRVRRASRAACFSREDLRAMDAACPDHVVKDLVARGAIPGPSGLGTPGQVSNSPGVVYPNMNVGARLRQSHPPGVAACDRMMDAQDAKDRAELIAQKPASTPCARRWRRRSDIDAGE